MICLIGYRKFRETLFDASQKHSVFTHFPKDPNCDICLKTKITRASCRRRAGTIVPRSEKSLIYYCRSQSSKHRYAVVVQDLTTQWLQSYPCKDKNFPRDQEESNEVPGADEETTSLLHCQFLGIWQNIWDCRKSSAQSLWDAKDQSRLRQFGSKVFPSIFLGYALHAGRIWKKRHHGRRRWRIEGYGRIWTLRPEDQWKGSVNANEEWKLHFLGRRWNSQNLWERTANNKKFFKEIQMNGILHPIFNKTHPVMMRMRKMTSGRSQENSFIVITLNPESNCTCRKKNQFLFR